jgi:hypothetical protein
MKLKTSDVALLYLGQLSAQLLLPALQICLQRNARPRLVATGPGPTRLRFTPRSRATEAIELPGVVTSLTASFLKSSL